MINFIICSNNYEKQKETKEVIVKYMMNYDIDYKYHIFNNDYEVKNNKVSGYNVYPSHIEEVLLQHPYIETCGVVGIPHPYKVQVPKAFLVLKSNIKLT